MITNLRKVDPGTIPGRVIDVTTYNVMNYRLRGSLEQAARLFLFLLECDSNNSNSKAIPREVNDILQQWKLVIEELDFGVKHNNAPTGSHEYGYQINLPSLQEIQRIRNVKIKAVAAELFNSCEVVMSSDCAQLQNFIDATEEADMRYVFQIVDEQILRWLGDGTVKNTGYVAPAYMKLGTVYPDVDNDYATRQEPSKHKHSPKLPDAVDVLDPSS